MLLADCCLAQLSTLGSKRLTSPVDARWCHPLRRLERSAGALSCQTPVPSPHGLNTRSTLRCEAGPSRGRLRARPRSRVPTPPGPGVRDSMRREARASHALRQRLAPRAVYHRFLRPKTSTGTSVGEQGTWPPLMGPRPLGPDSIWRSQEIDTVRARSRVARVPTAGACEK